MKKILFVCLGNICRSPMAEFIFKDMIKKKGLETEFIIASAGTSNEECGHPVYPPAARKLAEVGISAYGKTARQFVESDYNKYDYILVMEKSNIINIKKIIGEDVDKKIYRLLDFSSNPRDISDPWYTGDFDTTYDDIVEGLTAFLDFLKI